MQIYNILLKGFVSLSLLWIILHVPCRVIQAAESVAVNLAMR